MINHLGMKFYRCVFPTEMWNSRDDDQEEHDGTLISSNGATLTEAHGTEEDKISEDRYILYCII